MRRPVLVLTAGVLLAGCSAVSEDTRALDLEETSMLLGAQADPREMNPVAFSQDETVFVVLFGSSSCPPVVSSLETTQDPWVLTLAGPEGGDCTADYSPRGLELLPSLENASLPEVLEVRGEGDTLTLEIVPLP